MTAVARLADLPAVMTLLAAGLHVLAAQREPGLVVIEAGLAGSVTAFVFGRKDEADQTREIERGKGRVRLNQPVCGRAITWLQVVCDRRREGRGQ